jgi:hypothetical protein
MEFFLDCVTTHSKIQHNKSVVMIEYENNCTMDTITYKHVVMLLHHLHFQAHISQNKEHFLQQIFVCHHIIIIIIIHIVLHVLTFFNHLNICILTLQFHIYDINSHYCISVEYLPEDGRKRLKHVGGLPQVCILLYLTIVQLLEYILYIDLSSWMEHDIFKYIWEFLSNIFSLGASNMIYSFKLSP